MKTITKAGLIGVGVGLGYMFSSEIQSAIAPITKNLKK